MNPMYLSYDDDPVPARSPSARIWRDCARRMMIWTAAYATAAAVGLVLQAFGFLLPHLSLS